MGQNKIDPSELARPGTVHDPALEERRAREAAEREAESRASSETKFDELQHEVERERAEAARAGGRAGRASPPAARRVAASGLMRNSRTHGWCVRHGAARPAHTCP